MSIILFNTLAPTHIHNHYQNSERTDSERTVWVTIFVHGIKSIKPHLNPGNILCLLQDRIENTLYSKTIEFMRADPFFEKNQAMQKPGLHRVNQPLVPGNGAALVSDLYNTVDQISHTINYENHFYTFGWTGLLSHQARFKAAQELYSGLINLKKDYASQGINPRIRLVGYSHGGSVVLTVAQVKNVNWPALFVDEAVLLGTPIEQELYEFIYSDRFGMIYNIYSPSDRVQPVDIFGHGQVFTSRYFSQKNGCPLPNNLIQIETRILKLAGETTDELCTPICKPLVYTGPCKSRLLRDISPGHFELWFFGWSDIHYRPHLPLYPLPLVIFLPYIITHAKAHPSKSNFLRISIDPRRATMISKENSCSCTGVSYPFLSTDELAKLKKKALSLKPMDYTGKLHNKRIKHAIRKAKKCFK